MILLAPAVGGEKTTKKQQQPHYNRNIFDEENGILCVFAFVSVKK